MASADGSHPVTEPGARAGRDAAGSRRLDGELQASACRHAPKRDPAGTAHAQAWRPPAVDAGPDRSITLPADATVRANLEGKTIVKVVAVPGRMVNFVVKG